MAARFPPRAHRMRSMPRSLRVHYVDGLPGLRARFGVEPVRWAPQQATYQHRSSSMARPLVAQTASPSKYFDGAMLPPHHR
eukprot:9295249-Pyramimonas_sp.AAC.1